MSGLDAAAHRGLLILLASHRQRVAKVDERLERLVEDLRYVKARSRNVIAHDDPGITHHAYVSARRTLCGRAVKEGLPGRPGRRVRPGCPACCLTLEEHVALGLADPAMRSTPRRCRAHTKTGQRCQRTPDATGYCPSHRHLGERAA